jgi:hypothetical protein
MTDLITEEITGAIVTVELGGRECVVSYPMHNLLLFKKQTGLSLFDHESWNRLDFEEDSEAWTACLWAGLHQRQADESWIAPFTLEQLNDSHLIGLGNAVRVHNAMFRALTNWMPRKKPADAAAAAEKKIMTPTPRQNPEVAETESMGRDSAASGAEPAPDFALPASSF